MSAAVPPAPALSTGRRTLQFSLGCLEVELSCWWPGGDDPLRGDYHRYPSRGGPPDLVIEVEQFPGFAEDRGPGPSHPAFDWRRLDERRVAFSRWDAEGIVELPGGPGEPVRARFRASEVANAVEAIIRMGASAALPLRGGLILHASAIAPAGGGALVFSGPSGAGKSTIARLLTGGFPARTMVSDELLVVVREASGFRAHVSPFVGSRGMPHGTSWPIEALHFLRQAPAHARTRLERAAAATEVAKNVLVYALHGDIAHSVLELVDGLTSGVPCYELRFAKDPGVAEVLDITC